ncbi:DUF418 domain-containing protein [Paenibacillus sp. GSMTC-2017]|uniref:DUF418 domain-containing protein n=1 Tax=Paenibacillus sp. GSMTC-2017 TaxID=2794350 RepID=UPI0018D9D5DC|nr:DUF418 domain-containing protein [Paenibacillus sp. GSMTC-2017]MBH5318600.1 DUF418 domain-containing protein [Paenibacillus sp. GSMTC-2017]
MTGNTTRQSIVDSIRGFSLLGILLSNMLIFQYGILGKERLDLFGASSFDDGMLIFMKIAVEGSFMPIFTFLFGYGLFKMFDGLEVKRLKPRRVLTRRFIMLIGLGLLHSIFVWEGDILLFYGVMGFFLMLFLKRKEKTVLTWGIVILSLCVLLGIIFSGSDLATIKTDPAKTEQTITHSIPIYSEGTYLEIKDYRNSGSGLEDDDELGQVLILLLTLFLTLPMFLFGIYAAKKNWFLSPEQKRKSYLKGALFFLLAGYVGKSVPFIWPDFIKSSYELNTATSFFTLSYVVSFGCILALGYLLAAAWLLSHIKAIPMASRFAAVGKLSLTNYLLQSIICTSLFYGYGLGLFGKLGIAGGIGVALLVYLVQLFASVLYLKRFKIGPVEWLLRIWTYWSWNGKPKTNVVQTTDLKT